MIHLIDDDPLLLETTRLLLEQLHLDSIVYQSAEDFLEQNKSLKFDRMRGCIVSDIQMPGMGGLDCQKILKQKNCALPIIFISGYADVQIAVKAMRRGAFNVLEKPVRHSLLLDAIKGAVQKNEAFLDVQIQTDINNSSLKSLTTRETEVLALVVEGLPNKLIADKLNICQRTVEVHRAKIMEKMDAKNIVTLVRKVFSAQSGPDKTLNSLLPNDKKDSAIIN